jgi:hypothetical protein
MQKSGAKRGVLHTGRVLDGVYRELKYLAEEAHKLARVAGPYDLMQIRAQQKRRQIALAFLASDELPRTRERELPHRQETFSLLGGSRPRRRRSLMP